MNVNQIIREGRARLGLSEVAFAKRCGVSRTSIQHWEKEGGLAPSRKRQSIVAEVLGITPAELMQGIPPAPSDLSPRALRMARMFDELAHNKQAQKVIYATLVAMLNTSENDDDPAAPTEAEAPPSEPKRARQTYP